MRDLSVALDGSGLRIGIVAARFNDSIVVQMLDGTRTRLLALGVADEDISLAWVAGAFEIPLAARAMATSGDVDAVVCLGCVIRGETPHFDYVAGEAAAGIQRVGLDTGVPTVFGVLTTDDLAQAVERAAVDRTSPTTIGLSASSPPVVTASGGASGLRPPRNRLWSRYSTRRRASSSSSTSSAGISYQRHRTTSPSESRTAATRSAASPRTSAVGSRVCRSTSRARTSSASRMPALRSCDSVMGEVSSGQTGRRAAQPASRPAPTRRRWWAASPQEADSAQPRLSQSWRSCSIV